MVRVRVRFQFKKKSKTLKRYWKNGKKLLEKSGNLAGRKSRNRVFAIRDKCCFKEIAEFNIFILISCLFFDYK